MTKDTGMKAGQVNKEFVARLMASQAFYQMIHNHKPVRGVVEEYLQRGGLQTDEEAGTSQIKPNAGLFKKILFNLDERLPEIEEILKAHTGGKPLEPLLKSIMLCGVCELLMHEVDDPAVIINDYLNVTHEFYAQSQVSFVNGVLDAVAGLLRGR